MEIKQIPSKEVLGFLDSAEEKPYSLLDVRTPEEWNEIGRPDGEKLSLKTHFVSLKLGEERKMNENFMQEVAAEKIPMDKSMLIICRGGIRSQLAAEMLSEAGHQNCINISDGFEGNKDIGEGWQKTGLPCK